MLGQMILNNVDVSDVYLCIYQDSVNGGGGTEIARRGRMNSEVMWEVSLQMIGQIEGFMAKLHGTKLSGTVSCQTWLHCPHREQET